MNEEDRKCFARFLLKISTQQTCFMLKTLTKEQLQCLLEIILNVAQGVIPLTNNNKTRLKRRKESIRAAIATRTTLKQRRNRLLQIKNILPVFLKAYLKYGS